VVGRIVVPTDSLQHCRCELNIYFDCDYTILAMDGSLRPRTREVFSNLIEDEHKVFIWSGVGLRTNDMERLNLMDLISGIFVKPIAEFEDGLDRFSVSPRPDFVIDDHREIVEFFGGVHIEPYYFRASEDGQMDDLYQCIADFSQTGNSTHRGFKPPPNMD
jgi:hypothetical protein